MPTKPPTTRDKRIAEYLRTTGKRLHALDALQLFKCLSLRDSIFRLRKAGYAITSERKDYTTAKGEHKHHFEYFMKL